MNVQQLDPRLLQNVKQYTYLGEYLKDVSRSVGVPVFYDTYELGYDLKKKKDINVLYPISKGVFVHVYMPPTGTVSGYRKYVVIEPPQPNPRLLELIDRRLAEILTEGDVTEDVEAKKSIMLDKFSKITRLVSERVDYKKMNGNGRIPIYVGELEYVRYYVIRDKVGLGVLEPFLSDPWLEDITCRGLGFIYVVHKIFGPLETNIEFKTKEELDTFLIRLTERIGKPVSHAKAIVDATLPDGSRLNIVFGEDVSLHGSNFTIRRFSKIPISVTQLIAWGTMDEYIAAYLWILLNHNMSGFICGETASGKTTTLNAISVFIPPTYKIITIEDTAEVQLPHPNWVRELTRDTGVKESSITMFDLLRAALRQRPNYIVVGEIRGQEAAIAFQAMQSVSWDTPILIKNSQSNEVKLLSIGSFVDKFYNEGEEGVPKYVNGYQTLSLDRFGRVRWAEIRYVLRHRASAIYEIMYEGKGILKATGSHSVFVLDQSSLEVRPKPVSKLRKGDLLVTFVNRHNSGIQLKNIDIHNVLGNHRVNVRLLNNCHTLVRGGKIPTRNSILDNDSLNSLEAYITKEYTLFKNSMAVLSIDRLKKGIAERIFNEAENLGLQLSIKGVENHIPIDIHNIFHTTTPLIGVKSSDGCTPSPPFDLLNHIAREFFRGYIADMGEKYIQKETALYTTKDRELAIWLTWLARLNGFESKMSFTYCEKYNSYHYNVCIRPIKSWSERIPLEPILKLLEESKLIAKLPSKLVHVIHHYRDRGRKYIKRKTVMRIIRFIEKNFRDELDEDVRTLLERLKLLLKSDLAFLKVLSVKRREYNGYVYDISVPETELFIGGDMPVALHNTGHPVLSTFHAANVQSLVQRLSGDPIRIPKTFMDNLNFAVFQNAVWVKGLMVRRITSVNEIVTYDPSSDSIIYFPVFIWDPIRDVFIFRGKGASHLLENKIAPMRGISRINMNRIYEELYIRAKFLRELLNKKVMNYFDVWRAIVKAYEIGVDRALEKLQKDTLL